MKSLTNDRGQRASSTAALRRLAWPTGALVAILLVATSARAASPSFTLSPPSVTLPAILATPADVLSPAIPPVPGPMPPPVIGIPAAALGLLPGDVITGLSYGILPGGPAVGIQVLFSVGGASVGVPFLPPPANVSCEAAGGQALGDVHVSQPVGPPLPFLNVLALDGWFRALHEELRKIDA